MVLPLADSPTKMVPVAFVVALMRPRQQRHRTLPLSLAVDRPLERPRDHGGPHR